MKRDCLRTHRVSGYCPKCGAPMEVAHLPLKAKGGPFCERCCPVCNPAPKVEHEQAAE